MFTPSVLSLWSCLAPPTYCLVLFPLERVLPGLTGTGQPQPILAHVPFPLLVLSPVRVSAVGCGALGWLSHHSGRWLVPRQRKLPPGQGSGHGVHPQPVESGHVRLVSVVSACLQCASCGALHAWAGLCDLLSCALCARENHSLGSAWGWGLPNYSRPPLRTLLGPSSPGWEGNSRSSPACPLCHPVWSM